MHAPPIPSDSTSSPLRSLVRIEWVLLVLIFTAAIVARLIWIGATEAHFDELWHLELSTGRGSMHDELPNNVLIPEAPAVTSLKGAPPWTAIWPRLDRATHPPLYFVALRFWRDIFGESIATARCLTALFSALAVLVFFDGMRLLHGPRIALWAAAILAVSSAQIEIAQEIRGYSMATLLLLASGDALIRIERLGARRGRIIALIVATLATLLTHYFTAPVLGMMGLYALIRLRRRARIAAAGAMIAGLLIFAIVWGPMLVRQSEAIAGASARPQYGELDPTPVRTAMVRLALLPIRELFEPRPREAFMPVFSAAIFFMPWLMLRRRPDLLFWAMWMTGYAGFIAALDLTRSTRYLDELRHTIFLGPAVIAILAAMLARARPILANGLPAAIFIACGLAIGITYTRDNTHFSSIGHAVADPEHARDPIVFYSDPKIVKWWSNLLFMGCAHYSGTFPRPILRLDTVPATPQQIAELKHWPNVWLVIGSTELEPEQILPGAKQVSVSGEPLLGRACLMKWDEPPPTTR